MRMLSENQREQFKIKRKQMESILKSLQYDYEKVTNYFEKNGYKVFYKWLPNSYKIYITKDGLSFYLSRTARKNKVSLGRTATMRVTFKTTDIELIQSLEKMPYRFSDLKGNTVVVLNYDWSKDIK